MKGNLVLLKIYMDYKIAAIMPMNWIVDFQCANEFDFGDGAAKWYM